MSRRAILVPVAIALALQGCALKPEPTQTELAPKVLQNLQLPQEWKALATEQAGVQYDWLRSFGDPALEGLVAEALLYNNDLRLAAARVEQAAANVRVAGGELYPALSAFGRTGIEDSGEGAGLQGVVASASWEIDVWGRVRYGVRGARDQFAAAEADYSSARQSIAALVAKAWFTAIEAAAQRTLASDMLTSANSLLSLANDRLRVGVGSELDVSSARVNVDTYQDAVVQTSLARTQALRALETLLGRYPAAEIAVAPQFPPVPIRVPAGLPSELLERRPDVIAAWRRVGAAFNRVQQARAARLPAFKLTGSVSDLTSDLFVLQDRDNPVWGIGGTVFAPLFQGGALKGQVEARTAEQKQALAAYASTALKAFTDVEGSLAGETAMLARESVLATSVADSEQALRLAETRYRVGSGDLRSVQQQQIALNAARVNLLRVQSERRIQRVNLHLALGGDFGGGS
jgi:NodT family efflux transporter outer membrane factor (OMF) lipoprotein